jgi:3-dehydroquinate synthase
MALMHVVTASVRMKARVVQLDERESGLRMALNFGHTIGHAIEAATRYKAMLHGEAIAWGMIAALDIAWSRGLIKDRDAVRMVDAILAYGPLPKFRVKAETLVRLTAGDKKNRGGVRRFVLPVRIGETKTVTDVSESEIAAGVEAMFAVMRQAGQ